MKQVKAVILDWAGTTVDYGCMAPVKAFVGGFAAIGVPITTEMARGPMGMAKIDHVRAITAMQDMPLSEEEILKAYAAFEALLFRDIENHCDIKPHVLKAVSVLRERKIRIGSTTGYTAAMMEKVVPAAALQGYSPDFCVTPEEAVKGRPYPYMIWENMKHFGLADPREVVKVGDTVADMEEGRNANCWTVGVILGSSELGLGAGEVMRIDEKELQERKKQVRATFHQAGADYVIDDLNELVGVVDEVNRILAQSQPRKLLSFT